MKCFKVKSYDNKEKIGGGTHERYIIDINKFLRKGEAKMNEKM